MIRTQDEIVERIRLREPKDYFGFEIGEYIAYLDFEHAKEFLKEGTTAEEWNEAIKTRLPPKEAMIDYMPFAFEKAHGQRGISANRSIGHMIAWAWLINDGWATKIETAYGADYRDYGLHILRMICELLEINPKEYGDNND